MTRNDTHHIHIIVKSVRLNRFMLNLVERLSFLSIPTMLVVYKEGFVGFKRKPKRKEKRRRRERIRIVEERFGVLGGILVRDCLTPQHGAVRRCWEEEEGGEQEED